MRTSIHLQKISSWNSIGTTCILCCTLDVSHLAQISMHNALISIVPRWWFILTCNKMHVLEAMCYGRKLHHYVLETFPLKLQAEHSPQTECQSLRAHSKTSWYLLSRLDQNVSPQLLQVRNHQWGHSAVGDALLSLVSYWIKLPTPYGTVALWKLPQHFISVDLASN